MTEPVTSGAVAAFKGDPLAFLTINVYAFVGPNWASLPPGKNQTDVLTMAEVPGEANRGLFTVTQTPGYVLDLQFLSDPKKAPFPGTVPLALSVATGGADTGIRFLPWREKVLTALELDAAATWVFTGPLQGCHIYEATRPAGAGVTTYLLHANANDVPDENENERAKDGKANSYVTYLGGGAAIRRRLGRSDYAPADKGIPYVGFVCGAKSPSGSWSFFYYSIALVGPKFDILHRPASIPRA